MLAFTGRFGADMLLHTLNSGKAEQEPDIPASDSEEKQRRRRLHHAKAEAKARYNEGRRLARNRDMQRRGGASQPASSGPSCKSGTQTCCAVT